MTDDSYNRGVTDTMRALNIQVEEDMTEQDMIARYAESHGFTVRGWRDDEENGLTAELGRFRVIEDDEDRGLYVDDEGRLEACVVGAAEYGNQRVALSFTPDGYDSGNDVYDASVLEEL
jgi:hypothetical protein